MESHAKICSVLSPDSGDAKKTSSHLMAHTFVFWGICMSKYTLEDFVNQSCQQDRGEGVFELETPRMLELNLDGSIWTKMGTMVSYRATFDLLVRESWIAALGTCSKRRCQVKGRG